MADPLKIMVENWKEIEGIWEESGSGREAYGRTAEHIPGFADQVPYSQYLPYFEAIQATKEKHMQEVQTLKQEITDLKFMLEEVTSERDRLLEIMPNPNKIKVGKWNVTKSGKYYRAFRKLGDKMFGVHLGKEFDHRGAEKMLKAREQQHDFQEALANSRQQS